MKRSHLPNIVFPVVYWCDVTDYKISYLVKIAVTAVLVVVISEIAKRSSFAGALLASVPLVSVLAERRRKTWP